MIATIGTMGDLTGKVAIAVALNKGMKCDRNACGTTRG